MSWFRKVNFAFWVSCRLPEIPNIRSDTICSCRRKWPRRKIHFIIWLTTWAGKTNRILRCYWLPERISWHYLAGSGWPAVSQKKIVFYAILIEANSRAVLKAARNSTLILCQDITEHNRLTILLLQPSIDTKKRSISLLTEKMKTHTEENWWTT